MKWTNSFIVFALGISLIGRTITCSDQLMRLQDLIAMPAYDPHIQIEDTRTKNKEYVLYFHGYGGKGNVNVFKHDKHRRGIVCDLPYAKSFGTASKVSFGGTYDILAALVILDTLRTSYSIEHIHLDGQSMGGGLCFTLLYTLQNEPFLQSECDILGIHKAAIRNMITTVYADRPMASVLSALQLHPTFMKPLLAKLNQEQKTKLIKLVQSFKGSDSEFFTNLSDIVPVNPKDLENMTGFVFDRQYLSPLQAAEKINTNPKTEIPLLIHIGRSDTIVGYEKQTEMFDLINIHSTKYKPLLFVSELNHANVDPNHMLYTVINQFRSQSNAIDTELKHALSGLTLSFQKNSSSTKKP